jgi:hypothetical protein
MDLEVLETLKLQRIIRGYFARKKFYEIRQ